MVRSEVSFFNRAIREPIFSELGGNIRKRRKRHRHIRSMEISNFQPSDVVIPKKNKNSSEFISSLDYQF